MKKPIIAFIGGGNMATSIIGGLIENGFPADRVLVSDPVESGRRKLQDAFAVETSEDNHEVARRADVIVLAVKPQVMKQVAADLAGSVPPGAVLVSIAAGIPLSALERWLGDSRAIVRCMPNTPALVHKGASGLFANAAVTGEQKARVESVFQAVGTVSWLAREEDIDAVIAVSGSGPAYFFLLIETMEKVGIELGLAPESARQLSLQTALGAATMAATSDVDCAELRRRVSSPGGTTEQAIAAFMEGDFPQLVEKAMRAARQRAREMADEFSS